MIQPPSGFISGV